MSDANGSQDINCELKYILPIELVGNHMRINYINFNLLLPCLKVRINNYEQYLVFLGYGYTFLYKTNCEYHFSMDFDILYLTTVVKSDNFLLVVDNNNKKNILIMIDPDINNKLAKYCLQSDVSKDICITSYIKLNIVKKDKVRVHFKYDNKFIMSQDTRTLKITLQYCDNTTTKKYLLIQENNGYLELSLKDYVTEHYMNILMNDKLSFSNV